MAGRLACAALVGWLTLSVTPLGLAVLLVAVLSYGAAVERIGRLP